MDLQTMTAEQAADLVVQTYQESLEKAGFDFGGLKDTLGGVGKSLGDVATSAWKNPYVRNTALLGAGGAALGAARNLSLSPEERKRRSLSGDVLTGASLGGLAGAGGTLAMQNMSGLAAPAKERLNEQQDIASRIEQAKAIDTPWAVRWQNFKDKAFGRPDTPGVPAQPPGAAAPTGGAGTDSPGDASQPNLLMEAAKGLLPRALSPAIAGAEAAQGAALGGVATRLIRGFNAPRQLAQAAVASPEALKKQLGDKAPLFERIQAAGNQGANSAIGKPLKNITRTGQALGIPNPKSVAPTVRGLDNAINAASRELESAARNAQSGLPQAQAEVKRLSEVLDNLNKVKQQTLSGVADDAAVYAINRQARTANRGAAHKTVRNAALPLIGAVLGWNRGANMNPATVGPGFPSLLSTLLEGSSSATTPTPGANSPALNPTGRDSYGSPF